MLWIQYPQASVTKVTSPDEKAFLERVVEARKAYIPYEDEFIKAAEDNDLARAKVVLLEKARPAQLLYISSLEKLVDHEVDSTKKAARAS